MSGVFSAVQKNQKNLQESSLCKLLFFRLPYDIICNFRFFLSDIQKNQKIYKEQYSTVDAALFVFVRCII